jgi:hypothetical protein
MIILAYAAWVMQQPMGKYSSIGHAKRVAPAFIAPIMAYVVYRVTDRLRSLFDRRADAQITRLKEKLTKMVAELKDSTRYQRTQALIEKYDPEHQQKMMAVGGGGGGRRGGGGFNNAMTPEQQRKLSMQQLGGRGLFPSSSGRKLADRATSVAAGAVTGAGAALSSALGQLVGSAAKNLIADDPMVVSMLKDAQAKACELEAENAELRRLLGWPQKGAVMGVISNYSSLGNLGSGGGGGGALISGSGSGGVDFAFGSPVSQNPDPDALVESPRALPPLPILAKRENDGSGALDKGKEENAAEEKEDGDGVGARNATPDGGGNGGVTRRSGRRSPK